MLQDDDIIPLEALDLLRHASDELLRQAALGQIDLNRLAYWEAAFPPPRPWPAVDRRSGREFRAMTRETAYNRIRSITPC